MNAIHERLRFSREKAGFSSAAAFARRYGLEEPTYRGHENGSRGLKLPVASIYAKLLNVEISWLMWGDGAAPTKSGIRDFAGKLQFAPIISWVQAGNLSAADPKDFDTDDVVPIVYEHGKLVSLEVRGDSMNNVAAPESIIVVDYDQRHPYDGMLCIARVADEVSFKRYRDQGGVPRLEPDSTEEHDPIFLSGTDWEILGRVIWVAKRV